jgi:hypothetical protein
MTRILSTEAAIRYNVHDDRKSVRRVKIHKLRILPIVPKIMNEVNTTRVACIEISVSMFYMQMNVKFFAYLFQNNNPLEPMKKWNVVIDFNQ